MRLAYVFPGQGAQYVGMGVEVAERCPQSRVLFLRASEVLGFDLFALCAGGPEEELQQTANAQPAILTASLACHVALRPHVPPPALTAGLSLGEYTALVASGAIQFEDAVRVVRLRGMAMQEATGDREVTMAAILGLEPEAVEGVCREVAEWGTCEVSNYNAPDQVVIGGDRAAVEEAVRRLKARGARRAVPLAVSTAFHTSLMRPAAERLAAVLEAVPIRDPEVPVVSNVTAEPVNRAREIRRLLVEQVTQPVRWAQSVRRMAQEGVDTFLEIGPGKVLSGLIRRQVNGARTLSVEDWATLESTRRTFEVLR
jgi:[acyl-carrier-protein] S-malonyltransferase